MNNLFYAMGGSPHLFPSWVLAADEYVKFQMGIRQREYRKIARQAATKGKAN